MSDWFEDEAFWIQMEPFIFSGERLDVADEQVEKILRLVQPEGKTVLDLCCGSGRHAVSLAGRGFRVTGVDRTAFLLERAAEKARSAGVDIEWVQKDMRSFVRPGAFDFALNMFTSFGYFENEEEDLDTLRHLHESLKPGGACLLDLMGKECLAMIFEPTHAETAPDGSTLIQRCQVFDGWHKLHNEWILIKDGEVRTFEFDLTLYSGYELKGLLREAGFEEVDLYGDLDGNPYDTQASRLVALGRKQDA
jgi:SAM-dependent methyltransferase